MQCLHKSFVETHQKQHKTLGLKSSLQKETGIHGNDDHPILTRPPKSLPNMKFQTTLSEMLFLIHL